MSTPVSKDNIKPEGKKQALLKKVSETSISHLSLLVNFMKWNAQEDSGNIYNLTLII